MAKKKKNDLLLYGGLAVIGILIFVEIKKNAPVVTTSNNTPPPVQNPSFISTLVNGLTTIFKGLTPEKVNNTASNNDLTNSIDNVDTSNNNDNDSYA